MKKVLSILVASSLLNAANMPMAMEEKQADSLQISERASPSNPTEENISEWKLEGDMDELRVEEKGGIYQCQYKIQEFSLTCLDSLSFYDKIVFTFYMQRNLPYDTEFHSPQTYIRIYPRKSETIHDDFNEHCLKKINLLYSEYRFKYCEYEKYNSLLFKEEHWVIHSNLQKIMHFFYDTNVFSDVTMQQIQEQFHKVDIQLKSSFCQFVKMINAQVDEETTSLDFQRIVCDELNAMNHKDHEGYLAWKLVQHLLGSGNFDHGVALKLLEYVNMERYPEAEICAINLNANNPISSLSSKKRQLLTLKALWKSKNPDQQEINTQIKYLYHGFKMENLPLQLSNVSISLDSTLNLLDLVGEQKRQIEELIKGRTHC